MTLPLEPSPPEIEGALAHVRANGRRPIVLSRRAHVYRRRKPKRSIARSRWTGMPLVVSMREPFDVPLFGRARHVLAAYGDDAATRRRRCRRAVRQQQPRRYDARGARACLNVFRASNAYCARRADAALPAPSRASSAAASSHSRRRTGRRARTGRGARCTSIRVSIWHRSRSSSSQRWRCSWSPRGAFELDGSLERIFPEWSGTPHAHVTLRMLLAHTSGMNSGADYRTILGENVERFALHATARGRPGRSGHL